jgi:glycosyltransferase involved in cell wall biosynthesis
VATHYPNKIFNYFLQRIFKWPKLDELCHGVDIFWSPHINFSSFSSEGKKVLTIHDLSFLVFPQFFSWRKNIWHSLMGLKKLINEADVIIAISESTKNDIIKFFPAAKNKVTVVYSGCGEEFKKIINTDQKLLEIRKKYNLENKFILSLGTSEPRKNITSLIRAFDEANLEDYDLVLAGASGWKNNALKEAYKRAKNKDRIKLLGYIEKDERPYLYNAATIFAYPSFYEGFGLPVLEAMACGTTVITSTTSSLPEVANEAAILIDPNNQASLTTALRDLARSENLQETLANRGLERAKKFSWVKTAEEYIKIFCS